MTTRSADLAADIHEFFDDFVRAFCTFDGTQIAARYDVPGIALRADGSIQVMQAQSEVERVFEAAVAGYHREGCRGIRFKDLDVVPMGEQAVLGTVTWGPTAGGWVGPSTVAPVLHPGARRGGVEDLRVDASRRVGAVGRGR